MAIQRELADGHLTFFEYSLPSLVGSSSLLNMILQTKRDVEGKVSALILKDAAALNFVTQHHGSFSRH